MCAVSLANEQPTAVYYLPSNSQQFSFFAFFYTIENRFKYFNLVLPETITQLTLD